MTDQTTDTTQDTDATAVDNPTDATDPSSDGTPEAAQGANPNAKEAKYRVERNEARAEVETLQARLAVLQRAEVERLASAGLSHPSDLFSLSGNELADYLTEAGTVDAEKVSADLAAILQERPGMGKLDPAVDPSQGHGWGPVKRTPTWGDLLKP